MFRSSVLLLSLLLPLGCGDATTGNCTVTQNDDGSATVTCPDGSTATIAAGSAGADGADGAQGAAGADGTNGADGHAALIRVDVEAPGVNCESGGLVIHVGLDLDDDGVLQPAEFDSTTYVCDGADGTNGTNGTNGTDGSDSLIRIEDAGSACPNGGIEVLAGVDDNGDGVLQDLEVTDTAVVCDGADAAALSVDVEFPSSIWSANGSDLGAGGGGHFYTAGDYLTETFDGTGLSSLSILHLVFTMYDGTGDYCTVGDLSWDVSVNGTSVGAYGYTGGSGLGTVSFDEVYAFSPVSGIGVTGDAYTLTLTANETVCSGGGSWNWYPGGTATLIE